MSSVPALEFTQTGVTVPAETDILAGVLDDNNTAFGGNLNPSLETPQGQLASTLTAIIADKNSQIAYVANQVNPDYASGRWQDSIGRIYFIDRIAAQGTAVQATCTGLAGVVIPVGAKAKDSSGNIYSCTQAGTIPVSGSIELSFVCNTTGPIACPIGALNTIYQAIPGWDSITNASAGTVGRDVETRIDFETRRRASVALNAQGSLASVYAAVLNLDGVIDAYVAENFTASPVTVGATSYSLAAHSLYVAAVGGTAADIAWAIFTKKSPGCNTNGNTTVTVIDNSGYNYPYPSYDIKFNIPASLPILFSVQIQNNSSLPADIVTLVKDAIIAAFNGTDGGTRARIGSTITVGRFYGGVSATSVHTNVLDINIGTTVADQNSVSVGIDQVPTISADDITVTLI
jgi:hypothetical protein